MNVVSFRWLHDWHWLLCHNERQEQRAVRNTSQKQKLPKETLTQTRRAAQNHLRQHVERVCEAGRRTRGLSGACESVQQRWPPAQ